MSNLPAGVKKWRPVDETTSTRVPPSASSPRTASRNAGKNAGVIVFNRSGRFRRRCAIAPSCDSSKKMSAMAFSGQLKLKERIDTSDRLGLVLRHWPVDAARATIVVVHGLGEHIGRYAHVAAFLNARGFGVVGYDQRGHGRSDGRRGRIAGDEDLLADLALVLDAVRSADAAPIVLLGHSMGGLVAARFVAGALDAVPPAWSRPVDALVLSSPALAADLGVAQRAMLAVFGRLAPDLAVGNGLDSTRVSRDPLVAAAYLADPLVHDRVTPRLARFIMQGGPEVLARAPRWRVPTLLMWAGRDALVAPRGSAAFAAAVPPGVVTARAFAPLCHEIFNEPEQGEVLDTLAAWLDTLPVLARNGAPT